MSPAHSSIVSFHFRGRGRRATNRGMSSPTPATSAATGTAAAPSPASPLAGVVALDRYPLHDPDSADYREIVARARTDIDALGCSVIPGFFTPDALARLQGEARTLAPRAYVNDIVNNAYSTQKDPNLPDDHPVNILMERSNAFVPKASIPEQSGVRTLYQAEPFKRFVADCMSEELVFEYADPFAGLVLNVLYPGRQHPWHYDTNEFIVSTLLQPADDGGLFEYCPGIRSPGSENYDQVGQVIRGEERAPVRVLDLRPGDLQLFKGRYALHRVTRALGGRERISAIFAYAKQPGVIGKVERTRQLFGRVSEEHTAAQSQQVRDDGLTD